MTVKMPGVVAFLKRNKHSLKAGFIIITLVVYTQQCHSATKTSSRVQKAFANNHRILHYVRETLLLELFFFLQLVDRSHSWGNHQTATYAFKNSNAHAGEQR